jgi:hypothetical protein
MATPGRGRKCGDKRGGGGARREGTPSESVADSGFVVVGGKTFELSCKIFVAPAKPNERLQRLMVLRCGRDARCAAEGFLCWKSEFMFALS